jgi:tetratricopeptide (TPR) repeat protein
MEYRASFRRVTSAVNALSVQNAFALFKRGDVAGAEDILIKLPQDASALHLLGVMRVHQQRLTEAAELLVRSVALQPKEAQAHLNLGKVLGTLGRHDEAMDALRRSLSLEPSLAEAGLALARSQHASGQMDSAIFSYQAFLAARPGHARAVLELADVLVAVRRPQEAETVLSDALATATDRKLSTDLKAALARATRKTKPADALTYTNEALALDGSRVELSYSRLTLLEDLRRYDDAKKGYRELLEQDPANPELHRSYNSLLHRLGEEDEFLISYDRAPRLQNLVLDKANFLLSAGRHTEAGECFKAVATRYGDSKLTALGIGQALLKAGDVSSAMAVFQDAARRYPDQADIRCSLAGALCQLGDPRQALQEVAHVLEADPLNQYALAVQGTCWRLMNDERDEALTGYEEFIQAFDLEPPDGFSDMASFHAELLPLLAAMHPPTREYLDQSLRGGSQTTENILEHGHDLLEKLRARIEETVGRYIGALRKDERHPYLSRARDSFQFSGSWSSRLRDNGFHINHLHPGGWISSCYYVDLPPAVDDRQEQQGWIKFGQPSFDVGLAPRRTIQPAPGRLVLFPSYMWHGTIPFHDQHPRTTIAFDVLPG